jgi:hypothetical protein
MTLPDIPNPMLERALEFARVGCSVVPAMGNGTKRPLTTWLRFQNERADEEQISQWFATGHPGLGLVCGAVSNGLVMVELEGRAVGENLLARARETAFAAGIGELWRTVTSGYLEMTPSGGVHILYRIDGQVPGNQKLARRPGPPDEKTGAPTVQVLAETRGEGGYTIVAPSHGPVHPTGKAWQLMQGGPDTIASVSLADHTALCSVFRALDEMPTEEDRWRSQGTTSSEQSAGTTTPASATASVPAPATSGSSDLTPGDDYNARADWADILNPHGWRIVGQRGRVTDWLRPGKDDPRAISATTGYGGDRGDYLYVFSTSTLFDSEKPYSKFSAYTLLQHNGDFSAAARQLRHDGYGNAPQHLDPRDLLPPLVLTDGTAALQTPVPTGAPEQPTDLEHDAAQHTTWWPYDLGPILAGDISADPEPDVLARADGHRLFYRGKVNGFIGESESGKTWIALLAVKQELTIGHPVLYLDFEDSAPGIIKRLQALGVSGDELDRFAYISPEESLTDPARVDLTETLARVQPNLIVVDGVNAAMTLLGLDLEKNKDVTTFSQSVLRPLKKTGAAVITIDHVTKSKENRGSYAIGAQAKRADVDGCLLVVEVLEPFAPGRAGRLKLIVSKNRSGHVRAISDQGKFPGLVEIQGDGKGGISVRIQAPDMRSSAERGPFRPTGLMEKVSRLLEALSTDSGISGAEIERQTKPSKAEFTRAAVLRLVEEGYVTVASGPRGATLHRSVRPYRDEENDPAGLVGDTGEGDE